MFATYKKIFLHVRRGSEPFLASSHLSIIILKKIRLSIGFLKFIEKFFSRRIQIVRYRTNERKEKDGTEVPP